MEIQSDYVMRNTTSSESLFSEQSSPLGGSWEVLDWEILPAQWKDLKILTPGVHEETGSPLQTHLLSCLHSFAHTILSPW